MAEAIIGEVRLAFDAKTLTISRCDRPEIAISLNSIGVSELIDFVTSFVGSDVNQRQTFRVPLWETCGLAVQIHKGDMAQCPGRPKNISLTGLFVELHPADESFDLAPDDDVDVILDFEDETQSHRGVIRHCDDNGYGILFRDSVKCEQIDPPPGITRIVMELQRRWMTRRFQV